MNLLIRLLGAGLCFMLHDVLAQSKGKFLPFPKDLLQPDDGNCADPGEPLILTPLIQSGKIQEARDLARVVGLSDITSYSGFLTVRKKFNANIFFWFFPAASKQRDDPFLIWLQGGPGVSTMLGLFDENGPFYVDSNIKLHLRKKYAWPLTHSILYFHDPVGTVSLTSGYVKNQDEVGDDLYEALQQFLTLFPEYRSRDLYVTGESYAGKYVTTLSYKIHMENQKSPEIKINLKGLAIGNPSIDPESQSDWGEFLYSIGLIDQNQLVHFQMEEENAKEFIRQSKRIEAYNVIRTLIGLGQTTPVGSYFANVSGFNFYYNFLYDNDPHLRYWPKFLEQNCTRQSIHVGNIEFTGAYNKTARVKRNLLEDIMKPLKPRMEALLDANESYKILIYSGQLDIIRAYSLTEKMIQKLKWNGADEFKKADRNIWRLDGDIVGYLKTVKNFTQLLIRNAGHKVPADKPKVAFEMMNRFTSGKPFV